MPRSTVIPASATVAPGAVRAAAERASLELLLVAQRVDLTPDEETAMAQVRFVCGEVADGDRHAR